MGNSTTKKHGCGKIVLIAILGIGSVLGARGVGYLAKIGPSPLRLQAPQPTPILNLPPLGNPDLAASNGVPAAGLVVPPPENITYRAGSVSEGNRAYSPTFWPNYMPNMEGMDSHLVNESAVLTNTAPAFTPASDLLTISPQMLVDYFRPIGSTNGAGVSVLVPVRFTPAVSTVQESSRSTYQSP